MGLAKINYYLKDTGRKESFIYINIAAGGKRVQKSTGIKVKPEDWDLKRQRCKLLKTSAPKNFGSNEHLKDFESEIRAAEKGLIQRSVSYDANQIWDAYLGEDCRSVSDFGNLDLRKVVDYWAFYIDRKENDGSSPSTVQAYKSALIMWKEFSTKQVLNGRKVTLDIRFEDLTQNMIRATCMSMLEGNRYSPKSVKGFLGNLGTMINQSAYDRHHTNTKVHYGISKDIPEPESFEIALTSERLAELERMKLHGEEAVVRDAFLSAIWLGGLRCSDWMKIKKASIKLIDGRKRFVYIPEKLKRKKIKLKVPVPSKVEGILERYPDGFPYVEENRRTRILKELGRRLGWNEEIECLNGYCQFWKKLGTHTARRTFASIMYFEKLVPSKQIMYFTCHKSIRNFEKYLRLDQVKQDELMDEVFEDFIEVAA